VAGLPAGAWCQLRGSKARLLCVEQHTWRRAFKLYTTLVFPSSTLRFAICIFQSDCLCLAFPPAAAAGHRLPQVLPGAGNFRRMAGPPVYGVAMCTLGGIRNVLNAVAQQQQQAGGPKVRRGQLYMPCVCRQLVIHRPGEFRLKT
jgi:hypothetical protein